MADDIEKRAMEIRKFNRFYTNIIGLVNRTILDSPYSLAEVRVMLEIDQAGQCTARDLVKLLDIDPGYLSRMLQRFVKEKLITKTASTTDGRANVLSLTDKGRQTFRQLSDASTRQIVSLLQDMPDNAQMRLVEHMAAIQDILSHRKKPEFIIRAQQPGDWGYIAYRHGVLYSREYGLSQVFERYVLESLVKHAQHLERGSIWIAEHGNRIAGFIAIVRAEEETAQLRWFLIEPEYRGMGLGKRLMDKAMHYCVQQKFKKVFLWTFQGLDAARHLYKSYGFHLTEQVPGDAWANGLIEEKWEAEL
ncbi:MAG: helix-turn-helix domain-containing GNAT family N-acetyltransferase [Negativicutes bacterium]|nr:helix-turn-helix domain-containing GNAT family N-acetyltransferase [Negativicutes bacterium]